MNNHTKQDSDRAALIFTGSIPDGEYNRDMRIEADSYGLEIDYGVVIPLAWIDRARALLEDTPQAPAGCENAPRPSSLNR